MSGEGPTRLGREQANPAVFVDGSGRRRRLVKLLGTAMGALLVASVLVLAAAMSGAGTPGHLPGWPAGRGGGADDHVATAQPSPSSQSPLSPQTTTGPSVSPSVTTTPTWLPPGQSRRPSHSSPPHPSNPK